MQNYTISYSCLIKVNCYDDEHLDLFSHLVTVQPCDQPTNHGATSLPLWALCMPSNNTYLLRLCVSHPFWDIGRQVSSIDYDHWQLCASPIVYKSFLKVAHQVFCGPPCIHLPETGSQFKATLVDICSGKRSTVYVLLVSVS